LKYFHTLAYVDGWFEFVFPMVVGPRFNPPGSSGGPGSDGEGTNGNYLKPGERTDHDVDLTVDIEAGVPIEEFECRTHEIKHESVSPEHLRVSLAAGDRLPNRDFVLRYRIAGEQIKSSLVTHQDERGGFFSLTLYPPRELNSLRRQPLELVFVIDCSGSMDGGRFSRRKLQCSAHYNCYSRRIRFS
jgi:Ca-activated chloride channel family protein